MKRYYLKKWGIGLGKFTITWYDLWDEKFMFEILFNGKSII